MAHDRKTERFIALLENVIAAGKWFEGYLDLRAEEGDKVAVKGRTMIVQLHDDAKVLREVYYEQGRMFEKPKKKGKD